MFQFLQPILLFSAAAIAIPVIIHLWNIKQGKTLKVGSISLLIAGSKQNARSLQLLDLLLLLLRCLLIILLTGIVAQPLWQQPLFAKNEAGWIMVEKENLHETYTANKSTIDSLIKSGNEFHYFDSGFLKDDFLNALNENRDTIKQQQANIWSLLKELNQLVPAELPVHVFVKNSLASFKGDRPEVSMNLQLHTYVPADSVSNFIANAFITATDSIQLLIDRSTLAGTTYKQKVLPLTFQSNSDYRIQMINGNLTTSLVKDNATKMGVDTSSILIDTSTLSITIFTDEFSNDAAYLRAAIESIKSFSKHKIHLSVVDDYKKIAAKQDWVFWLSPKNIPPQIEAKNIFFYEDGKVVSSHSWLEESAEGGIDQLPVELRKMVVKKESNKQSEIIWADGFGKPVLRKQVTGGMSYYHFYSRFNPEWNDLTWSADFPRFIIKLLFTNHPISHINDKRLIDDKQLRPVLSSKYDREMKNKFVEKKDLTHLVWLAAFLIFFIERWVSFKTKKIITGE